MTKISKQKLNKVLLFGGSGFLGPNILKKYPNVICVGRSKPPFYIKNKFIKLSDLKQISKLDKIKFDRVIFLIGNSDHHNLNSSNLNLALSHNFYPLKIALDYFEKRKVKQVITFSGALIYGKKNLKLPVDEKHPISGSQNNYLFSKYMAEQLCNFYRKKIKIINIRLSNIYGPTLLKRPDLVQSILMRILIQKKKKIKVWNFSPKRDFIHTDDVADAVINLLFSNYSGNINLGTGISNSVGSVCKIISKLTNTKILNLKKEVDGQQEFRFDINLINKITGWKPKLSLKEGLEMTIKKIKYYNALKK